MLLLISQFWVFLLLILCDKFAIMSYKIKFISRNSDFIYHNFDLNCNCINSQFWENISLFPRQNWTYNSQLQVYMLRLYILQLWLYNVQLQIYIKQFWGAKKPTHNSEKKSQNCKIQNYEIKSRNYLFYFVAEMGFHKKHLKKQI